MEGLTVARDLYIHVRVSASPSSECESLDASLYILDVGSSYCNMLLLSRGSQVEDFEYRMHHMGTTWVRGATS